VTLPLLYEVKQKLYDKRIGDIGTHIGKELEGLGRALDKLSGRSVAITAGSRGISGIGDIMRVLVEKIRERGGDPFLVTAMGSHGGATAEGQLEILSSIGITEGSVGAPIRATMDTRKIGETPDGYPVYLDKYALEADHIVVVNRISKHTDFTSDIESGLMKMMVVGLGNKAGAEVVHSRGTWGLKNMIKPMAREVMKKAPVIFGVAILENGYGEIADIIPLLPEEIEEREKELLAEAKRNRPRLPFSEIDVLVVDFIGKEISGTGLDTNVIGRMMIRGEPEPENPDIKIIVVLDISDASHGNAIGTGLADMITRRLFEKIDFRKTYTNLLVSGFLERGKIPLVFDTDEEAVEEAIGLIRWKERKDVRLVRIRDTKHLDTIWISEALLEEAKANPSLRVTGRTRRWFEG
jgi:hypothetical protein